MKQDLNNNRNLYLFNVLIKYIVRKKYNINKEDRYEKKSNITTKVNL